MLPNLHTKLILSNMMMKNRFHLSRNFGTTSSLGGIALLIYLAII